MGYKEVNSNPRANKRNCSSGNTQHGWSINCHSLLCRKSFGTEVERYYCLLHVAVYYGLVALWIQLNTLHPYSFLMLLLSVFLYTDSAACINGERNNVKKQHQTLRINFLVQPEHQPGISAKHKPAICDLFWCMDFVTWESERESLRVFRAIWFYVDR